jgi:hypothetical protein
MATNTALVTLTPAESKLLIARAVAQEPVVRRALRRGVVIIALGTTNAAVVQALTGSTIDPMRFAAGVIQRGYLCPTPPQNRLPTLVLLDGELSEIRLDEAMGRDLDVVIIKGANAVDHEGRVGVLMASPDGGTLGKLLIPARAAGYPILCPVGLEKLIPNVQAACQALGQQRLDRSLGVRCGMMQLVGARAITEIESFALLFRVQAMHVASGGVAGGEGSVTLALAGEPEGIDHALTLVESIKGAPPPRGPVKLPCTTCTMRCDYAGLSFEKLPAQLRV